ncbi:MAG TPA: CPBP family intramembrane glutamic endopeptidase [Candidatus Obscuribacterales bacterium]
MLGRSLWLPTWLKPRVRDVALLVPTAILFSGIALATYELIGPLLLSNDAVVELLRQQGYNKHIFWPLSFYAIVVNPVVEEIYWRGVVLNELEHLAHTRRFALLWSSFAYALFHYPIFKLVLFPGWAELGTFMLAIYGAFLAIIYKTTGSIITTAVAHGLLTDTAVIVLILDLFHRYPGTL